MKLLTRSEEMLLLAITHLGDNAYGISIRDQLKVMTGKTWSYGNIHVTLDRLEKRGRIRSSLSSPEKKRGGRSKRLYTLTESGLKDLREIKKVHERMWAGVNSLSPGEAK